MVNLNLNNQNMCLCNSSLYFTLVEVETYKIEYFDHSSL